MSNLSQFLNGVSSRSPASIVQYNSTTGWLAVSAVGPTSAINGVNAKVGAKEISSGALTANTLATTLSVTGAGIITFLSIYQVDATARTMRLQLAIDGVTVFDSTSASTSTANNGGIVIGSSFTATEVLTDRIPFNTSFVVKIASSLSETDKLGIGVKYYTV